MKVKSSFWIYSVIAISVAFLGLAGGLVWAGDDGSREPVISPNGKFRAEPIGNFPQIDYQVIDISTGEVLFRTESLENGVNDIKFGCFSSDSKKFAAVYFYGHEGTFSWAGIWDLKTGEKIQERRAKGYKWDTSWIF